MSETSLIAKEIPWSRLVPRCSENVVKHILPVGAPLLPPPLFIHLSLLLLDLVQHVLEM
jgi:hypothetical protein